jgi:hypothetical protein
VQRKRGTLQLRIAGLQFGGWFQALSRGSVWSVRALWLGGGRDGGVRARRFAKDRLKERATTEWRGEVPAQQAREELQYIVQSGGRVL